MTYKQVLTFDQALADCASKAITYELFVVMAGLSGSIDTFETSFQCLEDEFGGPLLLPRCTIEKS